MNDDDGGKKDKKEDRRKRAAGGKSGGGTQGRETKTKATKHKGGRGKKQAAHHDSDSDHDEHTQKHNQDSKLVSMEAGQGVGKLYECRNMRGMSRVIGL